MLVLDDEDDNAPYVQLAAPFERYRLVLPDVKDAPTVHVILSNPTMTGNMSNVPEPYTYEDALKYYALQPSNADFVHLSKSSASSVEEEERRKKILMSRWPFVTIRDIETNDFIGNFTIRRNQWDWKTGSNAAKKQLLIEENEAKEAGDESISYSIGYYLSPSVSSKGLMTAVVAEGLAYAKQYMNARYIQGLCRSDNIPSRRVLEKNGFVQQHQPEQEGNELQMEWKNMGILKVAVYNIDLNHAES